MCLQEADERREQRRLACPAAKLFNPDSGQVKEPAGPSLVAKRCSQRRERERVGIVWR